MTLSVVSALARLNLDPYREAARLAGLSRRDAATSLTRLVARLEPTAAPLDAARIMSLIQLLPQPEAKPREITARSGSFPRLRATQIGAIIILAAAVVYLYATAPTLPAESQWPSLSVTAER